MSSCAFFYIKEAGLFGKAVSLSLSCPLWTIRLQKVDSTHVSLHSIIQISVSVLSAAPFGAFGPDIFASSPGPAPLGLTGTLEAIAYGSGPALAPSPGLASWISGAQQIGPNLYYVAATQNRGFYSVSHCMFATSKELFAVCRAFEQWSMCRNLLSDDYIH